MNKKVFFLSLMLAAGLFAEEPPIKGGNWHLDDDGKTLNGKYFSHDEIYKSYREQDGWAAVGGRKLHYWLYDTYTYHDGDGWEIVNQYIPHWIESMGYVIDFDNIRDISPNNDLAYSVKALMWQRRCDVSVALITNQDYYSAYSDYVVINNYDAEEDYFWTIVYYLIK